MYFHVIERNLTPWGGDTTNLLRLQRTATHNNALQRTATNWKTLQLTHRPAASAAVAAASSPAPSATAAESN